MVSTVLARYLHEERSSRVGIGHVRYSTQGGNRIENVQPVVVECNKGKIALAHNGNISNSLELKEQLVHEGSIFQSTSDTELLLHMIARSREPNFMKALRTVLEQIEGAYSMALIHEDALIAVRDPHGFRPLHVGTDNGMTVVASETCALDMLKIRNHREVAPGEILTIDAHGERSDRLPSVPALSKCVFELIYFSRPDSSVFGESVHIMRMAMGAA
jgi:amidophosphoribosyltransferase